MNPNNQEQAIANDLNLCDLILAIGSKGAKRKAKAQRKACFDQIKQWNKDLPPVSDAELLAELGAQ